MNVLCREFESIDFDIKFAKDETDTKKPVVSMLPTFENIYGSSFSQEKYNFIKGLYRQYTSRKQMKQAASIFDNIASGQSQEDYMELRQNILSALIEELQTQLQNSGIDGEEFLFYCHRLSKDYASFNWGFAWDVLEDQIIKIIPFGKSYCAVRSPEGIEYLGNRYLLKDISNKNEVVIQKLFDALFGESDEGPSYDADISQILSQEEGGNQ